MRRLEGKVAVVTGAATGIGRASAAAYAAEGANVVVGDVNLEHGLAAVAEIKNAGGAACFVNTDVSSSSDCQHLVETAIAEFGRIDVMHANAGIELYETVWDTTDEDWSRVLGVNLNGAFFCCRETIRQLRKRGEGGAIIFTASPHAFVTSKEVAAYAASKAGMVGLMRAAALEGASYGIRVNAILPGAIRTPMVDREVARSTDPQAQIDRLAATHPLGRIGQPEDIARVAVFLASDDAAFVTGTCLAADGGLMAAINSGPMNCSE